MNDTVMINDHRLKISTKTVKANGRNYIYYIAKMNLGKDPTTGKQRQHDFTANSKENLINVLLSDEKIGYDPVKKETIQREKIITIINELKKKMG